jgi:hypothetical protein
MSVTREVHDRQGLRICTDVIPQKKFVLVSGHVVRAVPVVGELKSHENWAYPGTGSSSAAAHSNADALCMCLHGEHVERPRHATQRRSGSKQDARDEGDGWARTDMITQQRHVIKAFVPELIAKSP